MKKITLILLLLFLPWVTYAGPGDNDKLLQSSDITYLGGFRLPTGSFSGGQNATFSYGQSRLAYNKNGNGGNGSLFISGHVYHGKVAEITIPELVKKPASYNDYKVASVVGGTFYDLTNGDIYASKLAANGGVINNGSQLGGIYFDGLNIIGTAYAYYDAGFQAVVNVFKHSANLSDSSSYTGLLTVKPGSLNVAFASGYIASIPVSWQAPLGGKLFAGQTGLAVTSRNSMGPAFFAFDPELLRVGRDYNNPIETTPLLYYEDIKGRHPLGNWNGSEPGLGMWSGTSRASGAVFPNGTRSVLFLGEFGEGPFCYKTNPGGCVDPGRPSASYDVHNYPYSFRIWAYDANDFLAVKTGTKSPWEIAPYGFWKIEMPNTSPDYRFYGATWDEDNRILYVAAKSDQTNNIPMIHAFSINTGVLDSGIEFTCTDGVKNGDEVGIDCGGSCSTCVVSAVKYKLSDFLTLLSSWLKSFSGSIDINADGVIDTRDLGIMMNKWE